MERQDVIDELWLRYKRDGDVQARDFLILEYSPWVRIVTAEVFRRINPRGLEWGDHLQNAHVGLLEAMVRFDPGRGVSFQGYAKTRVRGAIFNGVRHSTRSGRLMEFGLPHEKGEAGLGMLDDFIADVVGIATHHLVEQASDSWPGYDLAQQQSSRVLNHVVQEFPEKMRQVFTSHYFLHRPFNLIAQDLGLTKGRVSQLHAKGLSILRERLKGDGYGFADLL